MPGYRNDVINFIEAADLLIHPSLTEASSNVIKEAGLREKAVAVCEGVGDFDDYLEDGVNCFLMRRENIKVSIEKVIRAAYNNKEHLHRMGKLLKGNVINKFSDSVLNKQRLKNLI